MQFFVLACLCLVLARALSGRHELAISGGVSPQAIGQHSGRCLLFDKVIFQQVVWNWVRDPMQHLEVWWSNGLKASVEVSVLGGCLTVGEVSWGASAG